jgi:hypothetical protein
MIMFHQKLKKDKVTGPFFFFAEHLITGKTSLTMLKNTALSHTPSETSVQTGLCTTSLLPLPFWASGIAEGSYSLVPHSLVLVPHPLTLFFEGLQNIHIDNMHKPSELLSKLPRKRWLVTEHYTGVCHATNGT